VSPKGFDLDAFVADCRAALAADHPALAVRDVLEAAVAEPRGAAECLGRDAGGLEALHVSDDLTVLNVVWAPGMRLFPHDHRMWAVIGIYGGAEDNDFFRRTPNGLAPSGGRSVSEGDVLVLGPDAIHAVTNPRPMLTGAVHVYGGDFFAVPRSEWDPDSLVERPFDVEHARRAFAEANERMRAGG